ncbi:hypothetical protein [Candidatus Methylomicrobium oryzae]|uniref:hypothetical protein n=1 Tax=Candidatus Methylomicrobium oryzae TaxID=2802053 RepID=UPI0019248A6C|nr:hypothetical protein [Methylomicrobium sp. RS1]MBL1265727.1 hypothetical protein [Methylomicrobium sp. RS1]
MTTTAPKTTQPATRLIPVPDWKNHHSWPPEGGLRHLIFNKDSNGFSTAFKKVGRRVLIDEAEFFACIERKNGGA